MTSTSVPNYGVDSLLTFAGYNGSDVLNSGLLYVPAAAPGECSGGDNSAECGGHGYCAKPSQAIPCETCVLGYGPECGVLPYQDGGICAPSYASCVCEHGYGGFDCSPLQLIDVDTAPIVGGVPGYYCPPPGSSGCESRGCMMTTNPTSPSTTMSIVTNTCIADASTQMLNLFNHNLLSSDGYFQGVATPGKDSMILVDWGYSNCDVKLVRIYFTCLNSDPQSAPPVPVFSLLVDGELIMKRVTINNCTETGLMEGQHVDVLLLGGYATLHVLLDFEPETTLITLTQLQFWLSN